MVIPRLAALKGIQQGALGRGENDTFNPTDEWRQSEIAERAEHPAGDCPPAGSPCDRGGLCSFLLAVTGVFSQERESKIVMQSAGTPGACSGKQGRPAAPDIQLFQGFGLPKWEIFQ